MKKHSLDPNSFLPKGHAHMEYREPLLLVSTGRAIPTQRFDAEHLSIQSYIQAPGTYRLPLRIDLTAKIDAPGLYVLLGKGHVNFGTMWSDNRRIDDIVSPARKTIFFDNRMAMDTLTDISLLYDFKEMQVLINGRERYHSQKERYMKSPLFKESNSPGGEGFELKIACDKLTNLCLQSVTVTEYDDTCGIVHTDAELPPALTRNEAVPAGEKPTFENCISSLPLPIQEEIKAMDGYLKSLKVFKFKRQLEKNGNKITYVASEYGFSYAVYLSNDLFDHSLQWYIITNGKPETWHRKADRMEDTLNYLNEADPAFAARMFLRLDDCVGCYPGCLARTRYAFEGKAKMACHGKLKFTMSASGFADARKLINAIAAVVKDSPS